MLLQGAQDLRPKLAELSIEQRRTFVKANTLCFNCLKLSHVSRARSLRRTIITRTSTSKCHCPTQFLKSSQTLLDAYFVHDASKILLYYQVSVPVFSRHNLIYMTYSTELSAEEYSITYRALKDIIYTLLDSEFNSINWQALYIIPNVDPQLEFFNSNIELLYNKFAPLRTTKLS